MEGIFYLCSRPSYNPRNCVLKADKTLKSFAQCVFFYKFKVFKLRAGNIQPSKDQNMNEALFVGNKEQASPSVL